MLAEYESALDGERIRDGIQKNAERCMANGCVRYGWDIVDGRYVVNEEEAAAIRLGVRMVLSGKSVADVVRAWEPYRTKRGGKWRFQTVRRILMRRENGGEYRYAGVVVPGGMPAIVKVLTDPALLVISFSLLMSDFFDTMGTAMAVAKQGEFLTDDGNVEDIKEILIVDSAAAAVGGFMGVSSITTFVESTSGAADGGRTGLTSVTTGVLFILAAFFSPIVTIVSSAATCGALVYVGYLMMSEASEIDWSDVSQGFPAFMIVAGVPFTYSISAGIGLGFIAYVVVALFKGEASKIKPLMWIAALAFLVYFFVA